MVRKKCVWLLDGFQTVLFLERTIDDRLDQAFLVSMNQEFLSTSYPQLVKNTGEVMAHGDDRYACRSAIS